MTIIKMTFMASDSKDLQGFQNLEGLKHGQLKTKKSIG